ncbi:DUF2490 domain-containing protein [Spongiimicrobium salis]|uniref:DUF2490 domain-containing protein n=1 Tax=Spongiimicrobium salis TaxID=1667022 RepID=UPI00374D50FC
MKRILGILFFCAWVSGNAQSNYQFGILPSLNLNKKLEKDWKLNLKIESRQLLKEGNFGEGTDFDFEYLLTDIAFIAAKKVGLHHNLAAGYQIRFREGTLFHRTIQQYTTVHSYSGLRLAHRIAADQTFSEITSPEYRFRYRLTAILPLSGKELDTKEWYVKINNEYLHAFQSSVYDLELRLVPFLGYVFTDSNKVEFGLDYRINSFLNGPSSHRFWWTVNWFVTL